MWIVIGAVVMLGLAGMWWLHDAPRQEFTQTPAVEDGYEQDGFGIGV